VYASLIAGMGSEDLAEFDAILVRDPTLPEPPPKSKGTAALMNLLGVGPPPPMTPDEGAAA
jgi:hypothetical protein